MVNITLIPQILNETNFTRQTDTFYYKDTKIIAGCIQIVILVVGVIGNGLVIFVTGYKMKTTVNSIWFLNLAIADFIFMPILVHSIVFTLNRELIINYTLYKFVNFLGGLNMFASVFFLTVISLDRCLCSWVVVWAQNKRTLVKARIICVFVWSLAICCSIPIAILIIKPKDMSLNEDMYRIYMFMVGFLFPFLIITSSYIAIGVRVKRLTGGNQLQIFRVISVILAFFICWFPHHVLSLCYISAYKYNWSDSVLKKLFTAQYFTNCLAFLNSCLNPILYVFMCDEYKKKLKKSLLLVLEGAFREDHLGLP